MQVAICTPSSGSVKASYAISLVGLMAHYLAHPVEGYPEDEERKLSFDMLLSTTITTGREIMMRSVLAQHEATHFLFIDDDMGFQPDILNIALSRRKPMVIANYRRRTPPWTFTARVSDGNGGSLECITDDSKSGLERALFGGFGFALMETQMLDRIPVPRFSNNWVPETAMYTTEDVAFMERVAKIGEEVYVDHDISKRVYHVGDFVYKYDDCPMKGGDTQAQQRFDVGMSRPIA
jgi:hypothetical protein